MVALWILGILLVLIVLILLIRVGVRIRMGETVRVDACIGPVKLQLVPKPEKKPKKEKKQEPEKEKPKKKGKLGLTFQDVRTAIPALFSSLKRGLHKTRKRMRIHPLDLSVTFGGDDPSKVAETYGWASTAMWTVMPQLEQLVQIPDPHIHLDVDFNDLKTRVDGEVGVSFQIRDFIAIAFAFGIPLLKWLIPFIKARKAREKAAAAAPKEKTEKEHTADENKDAKKSETIAE
ncbi:MAG: DUF2953 domain-containing protein [Clostridiales bacterium]|nr:DUF2953 domain-containing protein [Candidatus Cacconaster stercorequi]